MKARIQFVVHEQQGTFETAYLAFNEVPQNKLILAALIEKAFSSAQSPQSAAGNNGQPISYSEAKGLFQSWLDAHTFPVVVEVGGGDQKLHKVSGSDREYYMFQTHGMTRLHDVLVEPNTREMFICDTGKPKPIEEWYQKFVVPQNKKKSTIIYKLLCDPWKREHNGLCHVRRILYDRYSLCYNYQEIKTSDKLQYRGYLCR